MKEINIFWFRRDLRLHDNRGFFHALKEEYPVLPVFIFDTNILDRLEDRNDARVEFIHRSLFELDMDLRKKGSGILVKKGNVVQIFKNIIKNYTVKAVYANHDYEPEAIQRDMEIKRLLDTQNIAMFTYKDHVIFEKGEINNQNDKPYTVYTPYRRRWQEKLTAEHLIPFPSESSLDNLFQGEIDGMPDLTDIGFTKSGLEFPEKKLPESIIAEYDKTRDFPGIHGTSKMGIHLRFGTVSVRELVRSALDLNETWLSELIWREFFMMILASFPHVVHRAFRTEYDQIPWREDPTDFERWCNGQTGYPIVDAGMRELNQTGYMHNRVRMITASFLTKDLLIDWRQGEQYFASKLLDFELASNNGNWQWAAGTGCDAAPYFRIFNPATQTEKFDPTHTYIKKWVPEFGKENYPKPIVDHKYARERALAVYSAALKSKDVKQT